MGGADGGGPRVLPVEVGQGARGKGRHPPSIRQAMAGIQINMSKSESAGAGNRLSGGRKPLVVVAAASIVSAERTSPGLFVA